MVAPHRMVAPSPTPPKKKNFKSNPSIPHDHYFGILMDFSKFYRFGGMLWGDEMKNIDLESQ